MGPVRLRRVVAVAAARALALAWAALLAALPWQGAAGEAVLRRSIPLAGDALRAAPAELVAGARVDHENLNGDPDEGRRLHGDPDEGRRLVIGLSPLKPGADRVARRAVSIGTRPSQRAYGFIALDIKPE